MRALDLHLSLVSFLDTIVKGQEEREQEAMEEDRKRQEAAEEMIRQAAMEDEAKKKAEEEERLRKEEEKKREVIALEEEKKRLVSFFMTIFGHFRRFSAFLTKSGMLSGFYIAILATFLRKEEKITLRKLGKE